VAENEFDAIVDRVMAQELHDIDQERRMEKMLDDYIDGVEYIEVAGEFINEAGELYEPLDGTPTPGAAEGFLAEQRARAILAGEIPPASVDDLKVELPPVIPLTSEQLAAMASAPTPPSAAISQAKHRADPAAPTRRGAGPAMGVER
jgi:hypothetical protein